jgi:hypothetical protein
LDGCNSIDELAGKLGKNFGRNKRGEITSEEYDRLDNEMMFIGFFPRPPEPIPFIFKSKEDYFKARDARDNLGYARDEWENCIIQKKKLLKMKWHAGNYYTMNTINY